MDNADGRAATPSTGIDDQHRLTVGMQGHQHGADLVRHERIAEPDLRRIRALGAMSGVRLGGDVDVPSVNLTQRDQVFRNETQRGAPTLAHRPGVFPVTRRAEPNVALRATQAFDAPGQPVRHTRNG